MQYAHRPAWLQIGGDCDDTLTSAFSCQLFVLYRIDPFSTLCSSVHSSFTATTLTSSVPLVCVDLKCALIPIWVPYWQETSEFLNTSRDTSHLILFNHVNNLVWIKSKIDCIPDLHRCSSLEIEQSTCAHPSGLLLRVIGLWNQLGTRHVRTRARPIRRRQQSSPKCNPVCFAHCSLLHRVPPLDPARCDTQRTLFYRLTCRENCSRQVTTRQVKTYFKE